MLRILIVDDDPSTQMLLSFMLKKMGHGVILSNDGFDALEILATDAHFDVIVSDIHMPKMDGFHFLDELIAVYPGIPVIISSVLKTSTVVDEVTKKGAAFLPRPFTLEELKQVVCSKSYIV